MFTPQKSKIDMSWATSRERAESNLSALKFMMEIAEKGPVKLPVQESSKLWENIVSNKKNIKINYGIFSVFLSENHGHMTGVIQLYTVKMSSSLAK